MAIVFVLSYLAVFMLGAISAAVYLLFVLPLSKKVDELYETRGTDEELVEAALKLARPLNRQPLA